MSSSAPYRLAWAIGPIFALRVNPRHRTGATVAPPLFSVSPSLFSSPLCAWVGAVPFGVFGFLVFCVFLLLSCPCVALCPSPCERWGLALTLLAPCLFGQRTRRGRCPIGQRGEFSVRPSERTSERTNVRPVGPLRVQPPPLPRTPAPRPSPGPSLGP